MKEEDKRFVYKLYKNLLAGKKSSETNCVIFSSLGPHNLTKLIKIFDANLERSMKSLVIFEVLKTSFVKNI